eukprot:g8189.t1
MRGWSARLLVLALVLCAQVLFASAAKSKRRVIKLRMDDGVMVLNTPHFKNVLKAFAERGVSVMFHAPWCTYCRAAMPHFHRVANRLRAEYGKNDVAFAKVDVAKQDGLGQEFAPHGIPHFVFFRGGGSRDNVASMWEGDEEPDDTQLYWWMKRSLGDGCVHVAGAAGADVFAQMVVPHTKMGARLAVLVQPDAADAPAVLLLKAAAARWQDIGVTCAIAATRELAARIVLQAPPFGNGTAGSQAADARTPIATLVDRALGAAHGTSPLLLLAHSFPLMHSSASLVDAVTALSAEDFDWSRTGPAAEAELDFLVRSKALPAVIDYAPHDAVSGGFMLMCATHLLLFADTNASGFERSNENRAFVDAANKHAGRLCGVRVDKAHAPMLEYFGFARDELPAIAVLNVSNADGKHQRFFGPKAGRGGQSHGRVTVSAIDDLVSRVLWNGEMRRKKRKRRQKTVPKTQAIVGQGASSSKSKALGPGQDRSESAAEELERLKMELETARELARVKAELAKLKAGRQQGEL